jgi:hypothetical protein
MELVPLILEVDNPIQIVPSKMMLVNVLNVEISTILLMEIVYLLDKIHSVRLELVNVEQEIVSNVKMDIS